MKEVRISQKYHSGSASRTYDTASSSVVVSFNCSFLPNVEAGAWVEPVVEERPEPVEESVL